MAPLPPELPALPSPDDLPLPHAAPSHWRVSDLRAVGQLATAATLGVTSLAESVHHTVWRTLGAPTDLAAQRTRGITGLVYRSVRGLTRGVGRGVDLLLRQLESPDATPDSRQRAAVLAALNGVLGDRLAASGNPLATPMQLFAGHRALDPGLPLGPQLQGTASGHVLLAVHGLCMFEQQWQPDPDAGVLSAGPVYPGHPAVLAGALDATALGLRYNTGQHIGANGAALAALLENVLAAWPVPVHTLSLLTHSMGGLVARSAVWAAQQAGMAWPARLRHLVFLGTPHLGAPLEQAGHGVDLLLASNRWSAPFARLGQLRSAGITDLRHGSVTLPAGTSTSIGQRPRLVPLPQGVACYTVAASTAARHSPLADRLVGDGLVPLHSALGRHGTPGHSLAFAPGRQWVAWRTHHLQLLHSPAVGQQLLLWLAAPPADALSGNLPVK